MRRKITKVRLFLLDMLVVSACVLIPTAICEAVCALVGVG